jgi:vitamin B12 transporter
MRRLIPLLTLPLLAAPAAARAQEAPATPTLPETVVTGTRAPLAAARIPAAVTVITRQDIEERGYQSLAEALAAVPGLHLVQAGGLGQQASAFLRGTASRHVRVLLDGVPIEDPSDPNGAFNFGNDLLGDIERIEVVRGPASALYGSGAIGGVVNLITRRAPPGRAFAPFGEIAGGTQSTLRGTIGAAGDPGGLDWMLAGQALSTRGFNATAPRFLSSLGERDGLRAAAFTARLGATPIEGTRLEALLRWRENVLGLDDVPRDDPNYSGSDRRWFGFLRGETRLFDGRWTTGLRLAATQDRRRYLNLPDAGSPAGSYDLYRGERVVLDWANTVRLGGFGPVSDALIAFGVAEERERADSASGSPFFRTTVSASQRSLAGHGGLQFRLFDRLDLSAGLRHDAPEGFDGATSWQVGGVLALPEIATRLRAAAGTAFKAPSLFQRFGVIGTFFRGNPDLRPERSLAWEAGAETDLLDGFATVSALYFESRIRDLINFDAAFRTLENVDRARIRGAELGLTLRPAPWLSATLAWTITDARDAATGERLPRRPEHVVGVTARIAPLPRLVIAPEILFTGRSREAPFASYADDGTPFPAARSNPAGVVANLTASWRWSDAATLFAEGRNLGNSRFEPANGFVVPGRSLLLGVRLGL